ncbi:hypothetical protein G7K_5584-t1 [Saitoella complicata NRRL Y-17804]|uniref:Uncharacterized protein n=1 Tax=Saitoella complicata (strain BCRC 22490 / CBS 7301 / JCM 7358 / NBRC 10748 / NRRL Y-17804) TaxID=698492 RepID=A0A0E9NNS8_SAICN|nr:hypothetical protein G7K_5584-t1 [Saitoella complicata NRRL Y-17804]
MCLMTRNTALDLSYVKLGHGRSKIFTFNIHRRDRLRYLAKGMLSILSRGQVLPKIGSLPNPDPEDIGVQGAQQLYIAALWFWGSNLSFLAQLQTCNRVFRDRGHRSSLTSVTPDNIHQDEKEFGKAFRLSRRCDMFRLF